MNHEDNPELQAAAQREYERVAANAFTAEATWPALAVRLETTGANTVAATTGAVRITFTFE